MKKILSTTAIVLLGTAAFAQSSDFETRITAQLENDGYTVVDVETDGGELIVEATRDGVEFEFTYDATSEELLDTEEEAIEEDDDDMDESEEDEDMDDEDDDEDEDEDEDDEDEDEDDDDEDDDDDN